MHTEFLQQQEQQPKSVKMFKHLCKCYAETLYVVPKHNEFAASVTFHISRIGNIIHRNCGHILL